MSLPSKLGVLAVTVALTFPSVLASAQATQPDPTPEARLAWAKRHVELVCRPLEARQMFDRATRCYNDVARLVSDASKPLPPADRADAAASAARPAAAPAPAIRPTTPAATRPSTSRPAVRVARAAPVSPVRARPAAQPAAVAFAAPDLAPYGLYPSDTKRCSGVGCLKYTLLGVGF